MFTPEDSKNMETIKVDDYIKILDGMFKNNHGCYQYDYATLGEHLSITARNAIGRKYKEAGWKFVYHQTSLENGERRGFTEFVLSMTPEPYAIDKGMRLIR